MKHLFIVNPAAGKGKGSKYIDEIKDFFKSRNDEYIIETTEFPGHATDIAKRYSGITDLTVYSVGGDGTLNEVLNGIDINSNSLAIIPAGSGNDFFKSISGISEKNILRRTIKGNLQYFDLGRVNGIFFLNISSVGIDAEVAQNADRFKKVPYIPGLFAYIMGIFFTVFKFRSSNLKINIEGEEFFRRTLLLAVANGKYYGGGMKLAPAADPQDGYFDIYHVDNLSPLKILLLFPKLIKGTHENLKEVSYFKGKEVEIISDNEVSLNIDGEILKALKFNFEIIPKALKIIIPVNEVN
jgi:diacylglycerol kinase (ATP)